MAVNFTLKNTNRYVNKRWTSHLLRSCIRNENGKPEMKPPSKSEGSIREFRLIQVLNIFSFRQFPPTPHPHPSSPTSRFFSPALTYLLPLHLSPDFLSHFHSCYLKLKRFKSRRFVWQVQNFQMSFHSLFVRPESSFSGLIRFTEYNSATLTRISFCQSFDSRTTTKYFN